MGSSTIDGTKSFVLKTAFRDDDRARTGRRAPARLHLFSDSGPFDRLGGNGDLPERSLPRLRTSRLAEATLLLTDPRDLTRAERERVARLCEACGSCAGWAIVTAITWSRAAWPM